MNRIALTSQDYVRRRREIEAQCQKAWLELKVVDGHRRCPKCRCKRMSYLSAETAWDGYEFITVESANHFAPRRWVVVRQCNRCKFVLLERPADSEVEKS